MMHDSKHFAQKLFKVLCFLVALVLWQNGNVAFARDHRIIGFGGRQSDIDIWSPDKTVRVAQEAGSITSLFFETIKSPTHPGFGTSWTSSFEVDTNEGQMVGIGAPTGGLERKNFREFYPLKLAYNLGVSYDIYYHLGDSLRFYWSAKAIMHLDFLQHRYILTHDPNRSASCAAAVDNSTLDPNASLDPIRQNCPIIRQPFFTPILEKEMGINWYVSDHWLISVRERIPYDYRVQGYVFRKLPWSGLIIGYNW